MGNAERLAHFSGGAASPEFGQRVGRVVEGRADVVEEFANQQGDAVGHRAHVLQSDDDSPLTVMLGVNVIDVAVKERVEFGYERVQVLLAPVELQETAF